MKKGEIKRRKRVMPAPMTDQAHIQVHNSAEQGVQNLSDHSAPAEPAASQRPEAAASPTKSHMTESSSFSATGPDERHSADRYPDTHQTRGPLPADFTRYQSSEIRSGVGRNRASSRKRSISATEEMPGTPNNPIINAARQAAVVTAIDPSLTDADASFSRSPSRSSVHRAHMQNDVQDSHSNSRSNAGQKVVSIRDLTDADPKDHDMSDVAYARRRKEERRRVLEAEAQRMREALEAKERELLALNEVESR